MSKKYLIVLKENNIRIYSYYLIEIVLFKVYNNLFNYNKKNIQQFYILIIMISIILKLFNKYKMLKYIKTKLVKLLIYIY